LVAPETETPSLERRRKDKENSSVIEKSVSPAASESVPEPGGFPNNRVAKINAHLQANGVDCTVEYADEGFQWLARKVMADAFRLRSHTRRLYRDVYDSIEFPLSLNEWLAMARELETAVAVRESEPETVGTAAPVAPKDGEKR
jgi:hypothetical protein